jgi:DNA-binding response OmpR family regulator
VDVAHDGPEAHWLATENPYDAMVLDSMLPGMSGDAVCAALREEGIWTPILMLTAKTGETDEAQALDAGADDFLSKPFSYVVLLARLRALLRRGGAERPQVLRAGDLSLDPATHRVLRDDTEVALSPRQVSLLEYLLRHRGEVLSKSQIMEHVWDYTFEGDPNIVEVYVRQLRLRIDEPFGRRALQTVRGAGYRLEADGG